MNFSKKVTGFLCDAREKQRFNSAIEKQYSGLYRLAFAWCHQAAVAEDLVQETLLKAIESRKDLECLEHLNAWLCRIMHNQFLDNIRYNRRWEWVEESEIDQYFCADCTETQLIRQQTAERFYQALSRLSFSQREAITLADLQGFSYQEIAEITETPIGTVMSRISRGREKLKELLQQAETQQNRVISLWRS